MVLEHERVVIVAAKRTPLGSLDGSLATTAAPELGAQAVKAIIKGSNIDATQVDATVFGCVLPAGLGQAPARQVALKAGLSDSTQCATVNKVCGSGMQSVMYAHDAIKAKTYDVVIAGGMENMSQSPYLLKKPSQSRKLGHQEIKDSMFIDGLEDAYSGNIMGTYAEETAKHYDFTRQMQDDFAIASLTRAEKAQGSGWFANEITPVEVVSRKQTQRVEQDENPIKANVDKIPHLRPAFAKDGTITAANASSISDGAAAMLLMTESKAKELGLTPMAVICAHAAHSQEPKWFTTAPVGAIESVLKKANWDINDVDLFEINEAFAVVTMAAMKALDLDPDKVNVHGGACALGHPLGASGARIIVTLIHALKTHSKQRGIASLCIGGGEATAIAIELYKPN